MKSFNLGMVFLAMIGGTVGAPLATTAQDKTPVAYFLEQMPDGIDAPDSLPSHAKDAVIAKVRLTEGVSWLGGRDQSGEPTPKSSKRHILHARQGHRGPTR
jgi:hypothetical protein